MIEINLISEELRPKAASKQAFKGFDLRYVLYAIPAVFALLIILHIAFGAMAVVRYYQFSALDKKWKGMEPKRKILDDFNKEYAVYSQDEKLIKQFIEKRIDWTQKLNRLSLDLPSGIWFTDISGNPKELYIRGSVVSVERLEMSLIKKFIEALKADASFFKDFTSVDLGQLENKTVAGYDITEFNLKGVLRAK